MRLVLLLLSVALSWPAQASRQVWGIEAWGCGVSHFVIRPNMPIRRIVGSVAATRQPLGNPTYGLIRQALVSMHTGSGVAPGVISSTPSRSNHSLDGHLLRVNVKQTANEVVHMPISVTLEAPLVTETLYLTVDIASYNGYQTVSDDAECIDFEAHFTLLSE